MGIVQVVIKITLTILLTYKTYSPYTPCNLLCVCIKLCYDVATVKYKVISEAVFFCGYPEAFCAIFIMQPFSVRLYRLCELVEAVIGIQRLCSVYCFLQQISVVVIAVCCNYTIFCTLNQPVVIVIVVCRCL